MLNYQKVEWSTKLHGNFGWFRATKLNRTAWGMMASTLGSSPPKKPFEQEKTWNHHAEHSLYISSVQYALYITISDSQNPHVLSVKYQPFQPLKLLAPSAGSRSTNSPSYTTPAVAATSSWELIYQRIQVINFNWDWFSLLYGWVYIK